MILDRIRQLLGGSSPAEECSPVARALVAEYLAKNEEAGISFWCVPKDTETGAKILALPREEQTVVVEACVADLAERDREMAKYLAAHPNPYLREEWNTMQMPRMQVFLLLEAMLKKKLPFSAAQVTRFAGWLDGVPNLSANQFPLLAFVSAVEELAGKGPLDGALAGHLQSILKKLFLDQRDADARKATLRLQQVLGTGPRLPLERGEIWSDAAIAAVTAESEERRGTWIEFLEHCSQATSGKPSAKWLKIAREILEKRVGVDSFRAAVLAWFPLVDKPIPAEVLATEPAHGPNAHYSPLQILDRHADILRGMVWACEWVPGPEIHRALTALALSSYRKIPGLGPRLTKVGNACIGTLGAAGGLDAIGQLAILKVRVKFGMAQAMLEKALNAAAEKEGLLREDLEEMSVPAYGLTEVGGAMLSLGEATASIRVDAGRAVEIAWKNAEGKSVKAPPASVKTGFAEDLKELRQMQKDIGRMLSAQAERLDQLFLAGKSWPFAIWKERYLDHPLVGILARRLIWNVQEAPGDRVAVLWHEDGLQTVEGFRCEPRPETTVSLWHPLDVPTAAVQNWRERIEALRLRQPFKQAHREIYVLTPAEETTGSYSNRFAAHILKQHQFNALCGQRGWRNKLRLMVDDEYPPAHRILPRWNLRAEFWIEGAGSDYGVDTNEAGSYLHLSTDQVRFYRIEAPGFTAHASGGGYREPWNGTAAQAIPLREIPPLVLSEILRDVDLFVGVCSVGNDASWSDGGPGGRHRDYWRSYSFGELSGSAAGRKEILERLVPRLKIAAKCRFTDRFLIVQGTLHEYKIHLGSGNILMSPDDRYLCIVARQTVSKEGERVFLPFEGDTMLSVILSKAFLLANDTAISDPTIVAQIGKL